MKLTKELEELIIKWQKILKLEDWDLEVELKCDKTYQEIEKVLGFKAGVTRGLNTSTEEQQHSLIILNLKGKKDLESYLVHELNHSILNEMAEFLYYLIEKMDNEEVESFLKERGDAILEKIVWKYTRILLELNKKEGGQ